LCRAQWHRASPATGMKANDRALRVYTNLRLELKILECDIVGA